MEWTRPLSIASLLSHEKRLARHAETIKWTRPVTIAFLRHNHTKDEAATSPERGLPILGIRSIYLGNALHVYPSSGNKLSTERGASTKDGLNKLQRQIPDMRKALTNFNKNESLDVWKQCAQINQRPVLNALYTSPMSTSDSTPPAHRVDNAADNGAASSADPPNKTEDKRSNDKSCRPS